MKHPRWKFTPAVQKVLCLAAKFATDEQDEYIRLAHLERALAVPMKLPKKRLGYSCPQCDKWFGWAKNFQRHVAACTASKEGSEVIS
jgi:hypothetical protein